MTRKELWTRTVGVFLACVVIFLPAILLVAQTNQPDLFITLETMVLGWFAGAIIVGSHYRWRSNDKVH